MLQSVGFDEGEIEGDSGVDKGKMAHRENAYGRVFSARQEFP